MADYNRYIDGLMANCRRSVQYSPYQYSPHQPQILHFPQYFVRSPNPLPNPLRFHSFKGPRAIAPRPCNSGDLTAPSAAPAAYTHKDSLPAANAPRPYVSTNLPLPAAGPRPEIAKSGPRPRVLVILPPPAAAPKSDDNKDVPPAVIAPQAAIPKSLSPAATAPSPFLPLFQLPIASSSPTDAPQSMTESSIPICHVEPRKGTREGSIKEERNKVLHIRYKNMTQRAMREELKGRGLLCPGPNADLVKRLEQDDEFQAKSRTAENYDTMNPQELHTLCVRRFLPSQGTVSSLKDRLKAHDKREPRKEAAVRGLSPMRIPSEPPPALEINDSHAMLEEKPLVPIVRGGSVPRIEAAEIGEGTAKIVIPAKTEERVESNPMNGIRSGQPRKKACSGCRKSHRRCKHDLYGNEYESASDTETVEAREETAQNVSPAKAKEYFESRRMKPMLSAQSRRRSCSHCRNRKRRCVHDTNCKPPSHPKRLTSQYEKKPGPVIDVVAGTRLTRSRALKPKVSASQNELSEPAQIGRVGEHVERKDNVPKPRRSPLFYQPKDEITLLQICLNLKAVVALGHISGFWGMVQDTLQLTTGKPYMRVSRHVRRLVCKRRAERQEIEQWGKVSISRVSAECRSLLDDWINGTNGISHVALRSSNTLTLNEDEDEISLGEEGGQQLDSDDSALDLQKRSATDAWLDTSCDTTRHKKLKTCTSELDTGTRKSCVDSAGCWSVSGSSVTSESSLEDESEDEDEDEVTIGELQPIIVKGEREGNSVNKGSSITSSTTNHSFGSSLTLPWMD